MKNKRILSKFMLIVFAGIFLILYGCASSSSLVLEGIVETNIYAHYSEVSGKINHQPIKLGQLVQAGEVLTILDDSNERYALEQLKETSAKKQAILAELTKGADPEELRQCENNIALAEIVYENAKLTQSQVKKDYENALVLQKAGAMAQSELDKIKHQADLADNAVTTAAIQLDNARQQLILINKGAPQEKIAAAQADIALTEVQIRQTKDNLAKYTIRALQEGTVISKNFLPGDMVSPGFNLVNIASETEKHVVAYVPKEYLPKISHGQNVVIRSGENEFEGTISFIDVKAQYTPKDMQTSANKNKTSMKIKVNLAPNTPLKIGEKVELLMP